MNPGPVNCPQCQAKVPSGAAICPACDQILDESFLDGESEAEPAPAPKPAVRRRPAGASRPTGAGRAATGMNRAMTGAIRSARPSDEQEQEPEPENTNPGPPPREAPRWNGADDYVADDRPSAVDNEFEKSVDDIKDYVTGLELGDKVALGSAVFTLFCTLLPWQEVLVPTAVGSFTNESFIGILNLGTLTFLLACATVGLLVVRTRSLFPQFNPVMVWSAQLGTTGANIFWCLLCILHYARQADASVLEAMAGSQLKLATGAPPAASPEIGLFLALLGCLGSLGGALLGLRSKAQ